MRTCPSCGKANNPIRKYCVRCGKSLLIASVDKPAKTSKPSAKQPEIVESTRTSQESDISAKAVSKTPSVTSGDQWVRPSEISKDRMRTSSTSRGKSEMEKAKEAFAKAEQVGIQEEGGDIVETRMLRASEVRELMQETPPQPQIHQQPIERTQSPPIQRPQGIPPGAPPGAAPISPPAQTSVERERVTSTQAAPSSSPPMRKEMPASMITPQKPPSPEERPTTIIPQTPQRSPDVINAHKPATVERTTGISPAVSQETHLQEMDAIMSCITHPEDLHDGKIKDFLTELKNLHTEIQLVTANQISISSQLDTRVRESQNKSEVKRIQYESISEQMRLAKQEWDDAKSEFEKAENRRKKEISAIEDKIKNIQKRIDKVEGGVKKRLGELDKVREKIAQLQKQDS